MPLFEFSPWDFIFTSCSLPLFLIDIVLDVVAAVDFYKDGKYGCLSVLLVLLIGSSVLAQLFSWLWYHYDDFKSNTRVEEKAEPYLGVLHYFQLGIYVRHAAVLEIAVKRCCRGQCPPTGNDPGDVAVYLNHDLSMLRIIETFSESAPQIVLMLNVILQEKRLDPITALKTGASLLAVAYCVTVYHRSLRSFLPKKKKQSIISSSVYFLWNLLLLSSRIVALALFASVQPCFIFAHFLCSWLVLFFCAWRSKTDFMNSRVGEGLYRATVGLIWYFDWFSVVGGQTRTRTMWYHAYMLLDISVLCGLWFWRTSTDPPHSDISCFTAAIVCGAVVSVYVVGLLCKMVYYRFFHPNVDRNDLKAEEDEVDCSMEADGCRSMSVQQSRPSNKRMQQLAQNFYGS